MIRHIKQAVLTIITGLLFTSCESDFIEKVGIEVGIGIVFVTILLIPMGIITIHELIMYLIQENKRKNKRNNRF